MVHVFKKVLSPERCQEFIDRMDKHWANESELGNDIMDWSSRLLDITGDPIQQEIQSFLEKQLPVKLTCNQVQIQIWPVGTQSKLHVHDYTYGRGNTDYNTMVYLNDNFKGGEFITIDGFEYKPEQGTVTFFDGSNVYHGLRRVYGEHRYTLIFWWTSTLFELPSDRDPEISDETRRPESSVDHIRSE